MADCNCRRPGLTHPSGAPGCIEAPTADVQRELAAALRARYLELLPGTSAESWQQDARALLPTVQRLIADAEKRAAAGALREAADAVRHQLPGYIGRIDTADSLNDRAAALDPS